MKKLLALFAVLAMAAPGVSQQVVNPDADVSVARPAWRPGTGPRVRVDEAHNNFHSIDERYAPFAALLRNDGYRVSAQTEAFTARSLRDADILVIANASHSDDGDSNRSVFTDAEIAAVRQWVERGGALLLIADHAPFAGAATALGRALGVTFRNGYATDPGGERANDMFRRSDNTLADHPITRGAGGDPAITQVRSFTGSAFEAPTGRPLLVLNPRYVMIYPAVPFRPTLTDRSEPIPGLLQGATLEIGRGRVVVMGEAAMFSAQVVLPQRFLMGFGAAGAEQNQRFALNLMHWLSRRPGY